MGVYGGGVVVNLLLMRRRMMAQAGKLWLLKDGDECTAVTGGWTASYGTKITGSGYIGAQATSSGDFSIVAAANPIALAGYKTLYFDCVTDLAYSAGYYRGGKSGCNSTRTITSYSTAWTAYAAAPTTRGIVSVDVSAIDSTYPMIFFKNYGGSQTLLYNCWAEK
jgi:hypothetical protein